MNAASTFSFLGDNAEAVPHLERGVQGGEPRAARTLVDAPTPHLLARAYHGAKKRTRGAESGERAALGQRRRLQALFLDAEDIQAL